MRGGSREVGLTRRPNVWSQNDGSDPREGVRTKTKNNVSETKKTLSLTSFAIVSSIFSETRPWQRQGVGSHSGADKGIYIPFLKQSPCPTLSHVKKLEARFCGNERRENLVGLQETYAPAATALLLTSVTRVFRPHLELYGLNNRKGQNALTPFYT